MACRGVLQAVRPKIMIPVGGGTERGRCQASCPDLTWNLQGQACRTEASSGHREDAGSSALLVPETFRVPRAVGEAEEQDAGDFQGHPHCPSSGQHQFQIFYRGLPKHLVVDTVGVAPYILSCESTFGERGKGNTHMHNCYLKVKSKSQEIGKMLKSKTLL